MSETLRESIERHTPIAEHELQALIGLGTPRSLKRKEFLFREGEVERYLAFVRKGCLRYYMVDGKGNEHIIYFAVEGW